MEAVKDPLLPVVEIFGPTLQGEGVQAGQKTHFIRFGYCDSRCSWCDSPHAVLPELVKKNSVRMDGESIVAKLASLGTATWVTLSGGNPAMHKLAGLVALLRREGYRINIETQGTLAPLWIRDLDAVTVSPKPPSSGEAPVVSAVLDILKMAGSKVVFKIPIFTDGDFEWAVGWHKLFPSVPLYLSVGTERNLAVNGTLEVLRGHLLERYDWLASKVLAEPRLPAVAVLPQLHVLLWGSRLGV